ncbi:MAG TPA: hypothetical protein VNA25_03030 [Phycisphaerae bacterium]|nr:hypothetical protein [Phycisphaerae bacterium]
MHANPIRAGIAKSPEDYPWSSVHNYLHDGRELIDLDGDWWQW